jgi:hypothetical protein
MAGVPLDAWFRGAITWLSHRHERLLDEHRSGRRPWHYQIWNLLVLELWHEAFIDRARPQSPPARTAP